MTGAGWSAKETVSLSGQISTTYRDAAGDKCRVTFHFILGFAQLYLLEISAFLLVCGEVG